MSFGGVVMSQRSHALYALFQGNRRCSLAALSTLSARSFTTESSSTRTDQLKTDVLICGAGVAGISSAVSLAAVHGVKVVVVDERPPLSFTSSMSSEAYRNFWPTWEMTQLMNRSIDIMEERAQRWDNSFAMNRRGYAFCSAKSNSREIYLEKAKNSTGFGSGPLTFDRDVDIMEERARSNILNPESDVRGVHVLTRPDLVKKTFPFLSNSTQSLLYARRCGWINAQQYGTAMMEEAKAAGVQFVSGKVSKVNGKSSIQEVVVETSKGQTQRYSVGAFVNAAGPYTNTVNKLVAENREYLLRNEIHAKVTFRDFLGLLPNNMPMTIWDDKIKLEWTEEEQEDLYSMGEMGRKLLETLPAGVHLRPYGKEHLIILWEVLHKELEVQDPPPPHINFHELFAEVVIRGLCTMLPDMKEYIGRIPKSTLVDGGYYCQTPDNKLLIGPTDVDGYFVCAGFSGYGIMSSSAGGELLATHVASPGSLPAYANAFSPSRFDDLDYLESVTGASALDREAMGQI